VRPEERGRPRKGGFILTDRPPPDTSHTCDQSSLLRQANPPHLLYALSLACHPDSPLTHPSPRAPGRARAPRESRVPPRKGGFILTDRPPPDTCHTCDQSSLLRQANPPRLSYARQTRPDSPTPGKPAPTAPRLPSCASAEPQKSISRI